MGEWGGAQGKVRVELSYDMLQHRALNHTRPCSPSVSQKEGLKLPSPFLSDRFNTQQQQKLSVASPPV